MLPAQVARIMIFTLPASHERQSMPHATAEQPTTWQGVAYNFCLLVSNQLVQQSVYVAIVDPPGSNNAFAQSVCQLCGTLRPITHPASYCCDLLHAPQHLVARVTPKSDYPRRAPCLDTLFEDDLVPCILRAFGDGHLASLCAVWGRAGVQCCDSGCVRGNEQIWRGASASSSSKAVPSSAEAGLAQRLGFPGLECFPLF